MSSEARGRSADVRGALAAAARIGRRAIDLVAADSEARYLANGERQLAIERLLIRFGEALKAVPEETLIDVDPMPNWSGPKGFRDLASHWYEDGLDHRLIWRAVTLKLPALVVAIERWLADERNAP